MTWINSAVAVFSTGIAFAGPYPGLVFRTKPAFGSQSSGEQILTSPQDPVPPIMKIPDKAEIRERIRLEDLVFQERKREQTGYAWGFWGSFSIQIALGVTRSAMVATRACDEPKQYVNRITGSLDGTFSLLGGECNPPGTFPLFLAGTGVKALTFGLASSYGATRYRLFEFYDRFSRGEGRLAALRVSGISLISIGAAGWIVGRILLSYFKGRGEPFDCGLGDIHCIRSRWAAGVAGLEASQLVVAGGIVLWRIGSVGRKARGFRFEPTFGRNYAGLVLRGGF